MAEQPLILIIEDEYLLAMEVEEALTEAGFATEITSSGEQALALLSNGDKRYSALVTDVTLAARVNGWEVARRVREKDASFPIVDAQAVANAIGVSVRYANEVLAEHGTSITKLIQARRLARCRYALEDPNQAHRTVSEIAYGWGFADLTHFGRRFKHAYGILPSEAQRLAKQSRRGGGF